MRFAPWIKLFGGLRLIRRKIKDLFLESSADTTWVNDAVVTGYTAAAAADLDATLKGYLGMARSREPEKLEPRLTEVRCLVRLMVGAKPHSGGVSPADIELLGRRLPWFELDTVPGVGHFPHEEQPAAVMRAVEHLSALTASHHPVSAAESDDVGA
jgi:pimeloyl-ACP methyl ester carboxylesterase